MQTTTIKKAVSELSTTLNALAGIQVRLANELLLKDGLKVCNSCHEEKPLDAFYKTGGHGGRKDSTCIACRNAKTIEARRHGEIHDRYLERQNEYKTRPSPREAMNIRNGLRRALRSNNPDYMNEQVRETGAKSISELWAHLLSSCPGATIDDFQARGEGGKLQLDHIIGLATVDLVNDEVGRKRVTRMENLRLVPESVNKSEGGKLNKGKKYQTKKAAR